MPWHDPARSEESAEDRALRDELSQLLGVPAAVRNFFGVEPTPQMIALADDLRREALRRRHTARQRPVWMLLAAGLPLALAVGVLGSWGFQHKQRADALAAAVAEKDQELNHLASASTAPKGREPLPVPVQASVHAPAQAPAPVVVAQNAAPRPAAPQSAALRTKARPNPSGELVLEVRPYQTPSLDTQPVKGQ